MSMSWASNPTSTVPPSYHTTAEEDVALTFDTTALLVAGGAPSGAVSALYRVDTDAAVTLVDTPTVDGNIVTQRLRGLTAGLTYRLRVTFLTSGNRRAMTLFVVVEE